MPETHLRQPGFTYKSCGSIIEKEYKKIKETGDSRYIYQKELNKACFQLDMAYINLKDLTGTTASDKILPDKSI